MNFRQKPIHILALCIMVHLWCPSLTFARQSSIGIIAVAWNPSGKLIAIGGTDGLLQILDATTKTVMLSLPGHVGVVGALAWSPDGSRLASASEDKTIRIWNITSSKYVSGELLGTFVGHESEIYHLAWRPNGQQIVSVGLEERYSLKVWDTVRYNAQALAQLITSNPYTVDWSPDGNQLVIATGNGIFLFDTNSNTSFIYPVPYDIGPHQMTGAASWSPDGQYIAAGTFDGVITIWDAKTYKAIKTFQKHHTGFISALVWSPDGRKLASNSFDGTVKITDVSTGNGLATFVGSTTLFLNSIARSPDGSRFAYGGEGTTVRIVQVPTTSQQPTNEF